MKSMRRLFVVAALGLSACALEAIPRDHSIETTFQKASAATTTPGAPAISAPAVSAPAISPRAVSAPAISELPHQFKVATFNVHMEPGPKVAKAIASDRALRDVDLFMLEEVPRWDASCSGACAMGKQLGYYVVYAPGHHSHGKDVGVAILSKAPITSAQILELPWNDVHFNAGRRIALAATIEQNGHPITVYAVHLENRLTVTDRRRQMLPILEHARAQPTPVIIAGDFNTNPFTWIDHWLPIPTNTQDERLEELVRSYGFDTPCKDSGATHRYIGMKLDGIYTRGFETRQFATAHARDVSDHLALWAVVTPQPSKSTVAAN